MTICIAAICERGRGIIVCGDREIGINITSAEFDDGKWHQLYRGWNIGFAGTVPNAIEALKCASRMEADLESKSAWDVQHAIAGAYQTARLRVAETKFLFNRGWTLEEFRNVGSTKLPPNVYATIDTQISIFDFEAELILAGFGEGEDHASILTVTNPGLCRDQTKLGFSCIGSGATAAKMSLFAREYSWSFSGPKAAYYVYEAKVAAEKATGVGETTDMYLMRPGKDGVIIPIAIQSETMDKLKEIRSELAPREYRTEHHQMLMQTDEFAFFRNSDTFLTRAAG
jgi:20S proteasome alpha/beta subunit